MSRLLKAEFDCEVITPMFLGGSDTNKAELREASLRGVLRFWWRAIQNDFNNYQELNEKESEIFGSSDSDKAKRRSINIRIIENNVIVKREKDFWSSTNLKKPNWNGSEKRVKGDYQGLNFLYYSQISANSDFINPGSKFKIKFSSFYDDQIIEASNALKLMEKLGGLGARSRRAAGCFKINQAQYNFENSNLSSVKSKIIISSCLENDLGSSLKNHSSVNGARIYESEDSFNNWHQAVNDIGNQYEIFRFNNRKNIYETPVFGAPVMHNRKNAFGGVQKESKNNYKKIERRSSPVIISIYKTKEEKYKWIVTYLSGNVFPYDSMIANLSKVSGNSNDREAKKISTNLLEEQNLFFSNYNKV